MFKSTLFFSNSVLHGFKNAKLSTGFKSSWNKRSFFLKNHNISFKSFSTTSVRTNIHEIPHMATTIKGGKPNNAKKLPPVVSHKIVSYWLFGTSTLVFGIVVLGGLTRLTESGLSITEWKPITGSLPPLNQQQWEEEFNKYKDSPEFKQLNSHINLEEFKFIYSMEWGHRLMGRFIGMFFIIPGVIFWTSNKFSPHVKSRVIGLTALLGLQGFIGWWMVKSGLDQTQLEERNSKPTVSPYRLTTHLCAAFLMYLGVLWTGFEILNENKLVQLIKLNANNSRKIMELIAQLNSPLVGKFRKIAVGLLGLSFITAMSGGMVAGLDAGLIYNTFPHMGDDYIPSFGELMSPVFARSKDLSDMWWRNLLENPTTVQLVHRTLAYTTFFTVFGAHMYSLKFKKVLPRPVFRGLAIVMGLVTLQASLGMFTLIYLVPIPLAALHQAGALALLTGCLSLLSKTKRIRPQTVNYLTRLIKQRSN